MKCPYFTVAFLTSICVYRWDSRTATACLLAGPAGAVERLTSLDGTCWFQCSFDVSTGLGADNVLRIVVSSKGGRPADAAGPVYLEGYLPLRSFATATATHCACCQLFEQRGKLKRRNSGSGKRSRKGVGATAGAKVAGARGDCSVRGDAAFFAWLDEQRGAICAEVDPAMEVIKLLLKY